MATEQQDPTLDQDETPEEDMTGTRIYSYGLLPPKTQEEKDLLNEQLMLAHEYDTVLRKVENYIRAKRQDELKKLPGFGSCVLVLESLEILYKETRQSIKDKRSGNDRYVDISAELSKLTEIRAQKRDAWKALSDVRKSLKGDPRLDALNASLKEEAASLTKYQRNVYSQKKGLYYGTYMMVEGQVKQASKKVPLYRQLSLTPPPKTLMKDGKPSYEGKVDIHQLHDGKGFFLSDLFSPKNTQIWLNPIDENTFNLPRHRREIASRTVLHFRIKSEKRKPVWINLPMIYHRPLPEDVEFRDAWILVRNVGGRPEYKLQIACKSKNFPDAKRTPAKEGIVAVDLGWRDMGNNTIRIGYYTDSEGNSHELNAPQEVVRGFKKVHDLQSIRDDNFNAAKDSLMLYLKTVPGSWLSENLRNLHAWRSKDRLREFINFMWSKNRAAGDETIYQTMLQWEKQERHLKFWEESQRDKLINHRREVYKKMAQQIAQTHAVVGVEKMALTIKKFSQNKNPEEGIASDDQKYHYNKNVSAPGEFRESLKTYVGKYRGLYVEYDPKNTTKTCHLCGFIDKRKNLSGVVHTCPNCHATYDRDLKGSTMGLYRTLEYCGKVVPVAWWASGPVMDETQESLATP